MAKQKADYQKEAKALGLEFTSKTTVDELKSLIAGASQSKAKDSKKSGKKKLTPEQEQEQMIAERRERQEARRKEAAVAAENRAADEAAYRQSVRTGPQQALDRAKAGS